MAVERVVAEYIFVEVDEQLHAARGQHSLEAMGKLSPMHPERFHKGSEGTATWRSRQNHFNTIHPRPGGVTLGYAPSRSWCYLPTSRWCVTTAFSLRARRVARS